MARQMIPLIKAALEKRDARTAGKIADSLRFKNSLTYSQIVALVQEAGGTPGEWEDLMQEAEDLEASE